MTVITKLTTMGDYLLLKLKVTFFITQQGVTVSWFWLCWYVSISQMVLVYQAGYHGRWKCCRH